MVIGLGLVFGIAGIVIPRAGQHRSYLRPFGTEQVIMVFPMLPQEMVLAVWLTGLKDLIQLQSVL